MKLSKRVLIWINVLKDYILSFSPIKGEIMSAEETVEYDLKNHKCLIRYGDGEFKILNGQDVHYQQFDYELQKDMQTIVCEYQVDSPYLLCVPYKYFSTNNLVLKNRVLISCWGMPKKMFQKLVKQNVIYGDAFVFAKNNRDIYPSLWSSYSNIILVHNDSKYIKTACVSPKQKGYYVEVPNRDSYKVIDKIEEEIISIYDDNQLQKNDTAILIS